MAHPTVSETPDGFELRVGEQLIRSYEALSVVVDRAGDLVVCIGEPAQCDARLERLRALARRIAPAEGQTVAPEDYVLTPIPHEPERIALLNRALAEAGGGCACALAAGAA